MIVGKSRSFGAVAIAAGFVIAGAMGPAFGDAKEEVTTGSGQPANPDQNSTVETAWNPDNTCTAGANTSMADLLACVAEYIDWGFLCQYAPFGGTPAPEGLTLTPPTLLNPCGIPPRQRSDWNVQFVTRQICNQGVCHDLPTGLNIVRWDPFPEDGSYDPKHLKMRETSVNIKKSTVSVNRLYLQAMIHEIQDPLIPQVALGGAIQIGLNGRLVSSLRTVAGMNLASITQGLLSNIQAAGFQAALEDHYIVVRQDGWQNLKQISFTSTDPGIYISEIRLEPLTDPLTTDF